MVAFDGGRSHLKCQGTGTPTVILESGWGTSGSEDWWKVQPAIALQTRVCAYDRAGIMWSTPRAGPRDAAHIADELHALLRAADEPGPYVMVGHSIGGVHVRVFTERFPDEVAGLVFVDATPGPDLMSRSPADVQAAMAEKPPELLFTVLAATGVMRSGYLFGVPEMWPDSTRAAIRALSPPSIRAAFGEVADLEDAIAQAGAVTTLGDRPLVVLSAGKQAQLPGISDSSQVLWEGLWAELQNELATLSSNVVHRTIPDSDHYIQLFDPGAVIDAVSMVITSVRGNTPLSEGAG
jgi:pimeloyl-ACP methyl ester carboxylesterase